MAWCRDRGVATADLPALESAGEIWLGDEGSPASLTLMICKRRAVIDIGTNSVKLLVVALEPAGVKPVLEQSHQTRLGKGFYPRHELQAEAIEATARAVAAFAHTAREAAAESIRVIATSAVRDAVNQHDCLQAVASAAHLPVEVLSGDQEAELVFRGVTTDPMLRRRALLILDIGGGSTEFILGGGDQRLFSDSVPMGSVRLLERFPPADPPTAHDWSQCRNWLEQFLADEVRPRLWRHLDAPALKPVQLVGTGGTTTILARLELGLAAYERELIDGAVLSLGTVRRHREQLWSLPLVQRRTLVGLPPNRADVVLMGVAICEAVMEQFGFTELSVSTRGLRFGAVLEATDA